MTSNYYAVIMAGGGGTRLWPLSRQTRPKQMLSLLGERSMFQMAVDRLEGLFAPDQIYVVTVAEQAAGLQAQCPQIPLENYLIEPVPRGTASVVAYAAAALQQRDPNAVMAVLTADHYMADIPLFQRLLRAAYAAAQRGWLATLGIAPAFAATGYGYIQAGDIRTHFEELPVHSALRFKEKPPQALAEQFLASGDHFWNSGMFVWRVDVVLKEFERQMPQLFSGMRAISMAWRTPQRESVLHEVWQNLEAKTIDYGIMENAREVVVIPAQGLGWSDVGSWDALFDLLPADEHGNIVRNATHLALDSQNVLAFGSNAQRVIVTIGVRDLVVVDAGDVLLVCAKEQAQQVKEAAQQARALGLKLI